MLKDRESLYFCEEMSEELFMIDSVIKVTRDFCLDLECSGKYYGTNGDVSLKLSAERNKYINMLTILNERVSNLINLNLSLERTILLEKNSDNSGRQITTESTAN